MQKRGKGNKNDGMFDDETTVFVEDPLVSKMNHTAMQLSY